MLYSTGMTNRIVPSNTSSMQSPFSQSAFRQFAGSLLKSSPNPFEQVAKSAATSIANFLNSAQKTQSAAKALLLKDTSSLQAREALSSDKTKVSVWAESGASLNNYKVKVNSLAESQTNTGISLNKNSLNSIQSGANQFKINIGGKSTTITSHISTNDTNEQALTKLKNSINEAKTGVTASIFTDKNTGNSSLELKSDKTGTDQQFKVTDEVGNAAAMTGITTMTTAASNAAYSVNGEAIQSSQSNVIELERGKVTATLLKPSMEAIDIKVRPDEKKAVEQVGQLISSYNAMHDRLKEAGGYMNPSVKRSVESAVNTSTYEQMGIKMNGDGTLKLDESKFKQSLSDKYEQTNRTLTGNNGLARNLEKTTDRFNDVSANSLLNQKVQAMQQFAAYQSSMQVYLQIPKTGLVVNNTF
jgi:flagellar hook-associated protein 2